MGLSRDKQIKIAEGLGIATAESNFTWLRDNNPDFNFENFPGFVEVWARLACGTGFPHNVKNEIREVAARAGFKRAQELLNENKMVGGIRGDNSP
jgi:hypothetical protein